MCEARRPQSRLDPRFLKLDPESRDFPILHFGFTFPAAKFAELAPKTDLSFFALDSVAVERHVWLCCGDASLKPFTTVCPLSTTEDCMISLWTTKDFLQRKKKLRVSQVKHVLDIVRKELELGDQLPMWYWDGSCGPWYVSLLDPHSLLLNARDRYTCSLSDYNPPEMKA